MAGYTRQAAANIGAGLGISAADHNAEYNQIQNAFDGTTGHDHTGGAGVGPKLALTASVSGILPIANGGTNNSSFTAGSVLFHDGTRFQQDNASFFWDNTNNYLGIGTAVPVANLHVHIPSATSTRIQITNSTTGATNTDGFLLQETSSGQAYVWNYENQAMLFGTNSTERMRIHSTGSVSIGNTADAFALHVTGTINATTAYRINSTLLAASHLSNGTTGTGAVMLAASPVTTGTFTAAAIDATSLQLTTDLQIAHGGTAASTAAGAFANLISGSTVAIANGGTGATSAANAFANIAVAASSLTGPGYITLQNGLILQWGSIALVAANSVAVVFPIVFPTALITVVHTIQMAPGGTISTGINSESTSGFALNLSAVSSLTAYWFAVGI